MYVSPLVFTIFVNGTSTLSFPKCKTTEYSTFLPFPSAMHSGCEWLTFFFFLNDPVCDRYSLGLDISANELSKIPIAIPSHEWKNLRFREVNLLKATQTY